jgi:hypothetical protein
MFDGKAFGQEIVAAVKAHVDKSIGPLLARMEMLEARFAGLPTPKDGEPGKDADPDEVAAIVVRELRSEIDGVRAAVEALPPPIEIPSLPELPDIPALIADAVAAIPAPQDGKDADPEQVAALVRQEAERILAGWERPRDGIDGKSVTLEDVSLVAQTMISTRWAEFVRDVALPHDGKDGVGLAGMLIDREGHLVATMTDGSTRNLGPVVGKDGDPGKNGEPGKAGADGVGFDDLDLVETEAGVFLRCIKGETVKEWRLPIVIDRGVFKEGQTYRKGDGVTWGGSFWIAQEETVEQPDRRKGWRLAVKRGRDGSDFDPNKPPKPRGPIKVG